MGTGSVVCPACGGNAPKKGGACPYCGADIPPELPLGIRGGAEWRTYCARCGQMYPQGSVRCPRCPPADADVKGGRCPRCGGELEPETMGTATVDRCASCRGLWFDGDEIEHATDVTTKGRSLAEAAATRGLLPVWDQPLESVRYLSCVRCGDLMARRQVAPRTGVIVDICRTHGVWFDAGEFEHFKAFVAAGGLEVVRLDGVATAEMKRRLAATDVPRPTHPEFFRTPSLERQLWTWLGGLCDRIFRGGPR